MTSPLSRLAGLLADPSRAAFCLALLDGRAWTAGELARHAGIAPSTATAHLTMLVEGGLLVDERQGRHRYVRLAGPAAAELIEELSGWSADASVSASASASASASPGEATRAKAPSGWSGDAPAPAPARQGLREATRAKAPSGWSGDVSAPAPQGLREVTRAKAIARARTCYDHLAGRLGVAVCDALIGHGYVADSAGFAFTDKGLGWLSALDIDVAELAKAKRPFIRKCLDWTERRPHIAGSAGAALCAQAFSRGWVERIGGGRALRVTARGRQALETELGLAENQWS